MSIVTSQELDEDIVYPDSDGQPMAENTLQFRWIVTIEGNLEAMFADDPQVFVAGDLFWYPVKGDPTIRTAPDALVALGRPKGYRGSYQQWREGGVAPQVVWEILSPGNRPGELQEKLEFYERYGAQEYCQYDPDRLTLRVWVRSGARLLEVNEPSGWKSPLLGIRLEMGPEGLEIYKPDGSRFLTFLELEQRRKAAEEEAKRERQHREAIQRQAEAAQQQAERERQQRAAAQQQAERERQQREAAQQQAERERQQRETAQQQAERERQQREAAQERAEKLAQQLRALGIDPDSM